VTDVEFARAFENGAVTPAEFGHHAHMRVAWVYLREQPTMGAALEHMRAAIKRFAAAAGASQKYHETITVLWMLLLAEARNGETDTRELGEVLRDHPRLADKDLPLTYYSRERLFGDVARATWVSPDLPEGERFCRQHRILG
jgi:hypothetical protein